MFKVTFEYWCTILAKEQTHDKYYESLEDAKEAERKNADWRIVKVEEFEIFDSKKARELHSKGENLDFFDHHHYWNNLDGRVSLLGHYEKWKLRKGKLIFTVLEKFISDAIDTYCENNHKELNKEQKESVIINCVNYFLDRGYSTEDSIDKRLLQEQLEIQIGLSFLHFSLSLVNGAKLPTELETLLEKYYHTDSDVGYEYRNVPKNFVDILIKYADYFHALNKGKSPFIQINLQSESVFC